MKSQFTTSIGTDNILTLPEFPNWRGKKICVTIGEVSQHKTMAQLGYFFAGIIEAIADQVGVEDRNKIKLWLYDQCLKVEFVDPFTGEISYVTGSLSMLNRKETAQFIDRCIRRASEEGIDIPLPLWVREIRDENR